MHSLRQKLKKTVVFSLLLLVILVPIACKEQGTAKTNSVKETPAIKLGKEAIRIADQYLDFQISNADALKALNELGKRAEKMEDTKAIDVPLLLLQTDLEMDSMVSVTSSQYDDILKHRNMLAERCGVDLRDN